MSGSQAGGKWNKGARQVGDGRVRRQVGDRRRTTERRTNYGGTRPIQVENMWETSRNKVQRRDDMEKLCLGKQDVGWRQVGDNGGDKSAKNRSRFIKRWKEQNRAFKKGKQEMNLGQGETQETGEENQERGGANSRKEQRQGRREASETRP